MNLSDIVLEWQGRLNFAQVVSFAATRVNQGISPEGVYAEVMSRFGPPPERHESSILTDMEGRREK